MAEIDITKKNWAYVWVLLSAARDIESVDTVPGLLKRVIDNEAWREFYCEPMRTVVHYETFRDFVEAKSPYGLGVTIDRLMDICGGNNLYDENLGINLGLWLKGRIRELTVDRVGGDGTNQYKLANTDNVSICEKEGSNDKKDHGNTASYGLDRLKRAAQTDEGLAPVLDAVLKGKKSVNKALVEAGIRPKTATFTLEPDQFAVQVARKFKYEEVKRIIELLEDMTV